LSKVRIHRSENGVRTASVLQVLLGVERTVVERAELAVDREGDLALIVRVRPRRGDR
jgi:hypothetical protein